MDLTTLDKVKIWCKIKGNDIDPILPDLITSTSDYLIKEIGFKTLTPTAITEYHNGRGLQYVYPKNRPIISVQSIKVNGTTIPVQSQVNGAGYVYSEDAIHINGYYASPGFRNVEINITSGYLPADPIWKMLEENVLKMINKTLDRRNHPDQQFQHSGTQIITRFNNDDLSPEVKRFINTMKDRVQVVL